MEINIREINIRNVTTVGVGLVGSAWAAFFASQGFPVTMFDAQPEALREGHLKAVEHLEFLRRHGRTLPDLPPSSATLLRTTDSLEDAASEADLVVESASERYDVKTPLFETLDRLTRPSCVLTSSSSGLLMTEIQQRLSHPERAMVAHPFNPAHLVPLVELVAGQQTDRDLVTQMQAFFARLGKVAIIVRREVPGYIGNRLQAAVWREAINLVLQGVGTVEDVDKALCAGPGIRWALMGQHLTFHLGGGQGGIEYFTDHIGRSMQQLWEDMAAWTTIPGEAKSRLAEGVQQELQGRSIAELETWRDEKLAELLKLLHSASPASDGRPPT